MIHRYLIRNCLFYIFLILLAGVFFIYSMSLIKELDDQSISTLNKFVYLSFYLPQYLYWLLPLGILVGSTIGLMSLVNSSEWVIIRTSGLSLWRIVGTLSTIGLAGVLLMFFLSEGVLPFSNNEASLYHLHRSGSSLSTDFKSGFWSKDKSGDFINASKINLDKSLQDLSIFHYDKNQSQLLSLTQAKSARFTPPSSWQLSQVRVYNFASDSITSTFKPTAQWFTSLNPKDFNSLLVEVDNLSIISLWNYITTNRKVGLSVDRYEVVLWNKIFYPLSCLYMAYLALAFVPNNKRGNNLANQVFLGSILGVFLFFGFRTLSYMAFLFSWNAILANLIPSVLILGFSLTVIKSKNGT